MLRKIVNSLIRFTWKFNPRPLQIFISYRLNDIDGPKRAPGANRETNPTTREISNELRAIVGDLRDPKYNQIQRDQCNRIYLDADDLQPGDDWAKSLRQSHRESSAVICLIGVNWLREVKRSPNGKSVIRLFEPHDVLRSELDVALARGIPVIPILINGAKPPKQRDLPPQLVLRGFHDLQFTRVDATSPQLHGKLEGIVNAIENRLDSERHDEWVATFQDLAVLGSVVTAIVVPFGYLAYRFWPVFQVNGLVVLAILMLTTLFLVPAICFWKNLYLIYNIRNEEPGFDWFSAYQELISCCIQSLGSWDVKLVTRVRTEAAMLTPIDESDRKKTIRNTAKEALGVKRARSSDAERPELPAKTCFRLNSARKGIQKYLDLRKRLWPMESENSELFCWIAVEQGFLSPQFLVAGLQDRFDEDWRPSLNWYGTAVEHRHDAVSKRLRQYQSFQFLCWLTWGPSIPHCTCAQWRVSHAGQSPDRAPLMLQFGYGDENNSWLIVDSPELSFPLKQFLKRSISTSPAWAFQCVAKVIPVSISQVKHQMCVAQQDAPSDLALKVLVVDEFSGSRVHESRRIYQAYVWVMFVLCDENGHELFPENPWYGLLPFFTHGNIAEPETFQFIRRELARKSLDCIEDLATDSAKTYFRYACASDHPNCNHRLEFDPPSPTILEFFREELANRHDFPAFSRILLPEVDQESEDFAILYSGCHLPERVSDFYRFLEASQKCADEVAERP